MQHTTQGERERVTTAYGGGDIRWSLPVGKKGPRDRVVSRRGWFGCLVWIHSTSGTLPLDRLSRGMIIIPFLARGILRPVPARWQRGWRIVVVVVLVVRVVGSRWDLVLVVCIFVFLFGRSHCRRHCACFGCRHRCGWLVPRAGSRGGTIIIDLSRTGILSGRPSIREMVLVVVLAVVIVVVRWLLMVRYRLQQLLVILVLGRMVLLVLRLLVFLLQGQGDLIQGMLRGRGIQQHGSRRGRGFLGGFARFGLFGLWGVLVGCRVVRSQSFFMVQRRRRQGIAKIARSKSFSRGKDIVTFGTLKGGAGHEIGTILGVVHVLVALLGRFVGGHIGLLLLWWWLWFVVLLLRFLSKLRIDLNLLVQGEQSLGFSRGIFHLSFGVPIVLLVVVVVGCRRSDGGLRLLNHDTIDGLEGCQGRRRWPMIFGGCGGRLLKGLPSSGSITAQDGFGHTAVHRTKHVRVVVIVWLWRRRCIHGLLPVGRRAEVRLQRSGALLRRCAVFPLEITCYYSRYVLTQ